MAKITGTIHADVTMFSTSSFKDRESNRAKFKAMFGDLRVPAVKTKDGVIPAHDYLG